jgi:CMP-N-acetylneuraminic acid synthetase
MTRIAALIPMRHHSQRVPGKNYRLVAGKPLFHYILETLLAVREIGELIVDTDSDVIMSGVRQHFPHVSIIERPDALRGDHVPMNDILAHDTANVKADFYLQTHATNPLLRPETISRAIGTFESNSPAYDSLFSVTRLQSRLYDQAGNAINHDPTELIRTQDLAPVYEENSGLYLFTRDNLVARHHRIGTHPFLFEVDAEEAWDIDDELDLAICEFLMARKRPVAEPRT